MLKVRLQRIGKLNKAYFRVVVTEHTTKPKGRYLELLGSYDPHSNNLKVNIERVKHWLSNGAKLSPTVNNLLVGRKLLEGEKVTVWKPKKKQAATQETNQKTDNNKQETSQKTVNSKQEAGNGETSQETENKEQEVPVES